MISTLIMVVALSRAAVSYQAPRLVTADTGAKRAVLQYIRAQNERSPALMGPVLAAKFLTFSATGTTVATDTRPQMLAGLQQGSENQRMSLSLGKLVSCGRTAGVQKWVVPTPMGNENCRVKMIPGEARALINVQIKIRVSPTQWQTESGQFIFYLKRQAGKWVVYGSQPG